MEMFLISFGVYLLIALALAVGMLLTGRKLQAGCSGPLDTGRCKSTSKCLGNCRRSR